MIILNFSNDCSTDYNYQNNTSKEYHSALRFKKAFLYGNNS